MGAAHTEMSGNSGGVPKGANDPESRESGDKKSMNVQSETEKRLAKNSPDLAQHVRFKVTDEGLRIEITDRDGASMYESGSSEPTPKMRRILAVVAEVLKDTENPLSITGHTDGVQFSDASGHSNWDLSAERAAAARRLLAGEGIGSNRISKIEGRADVQPLLPEAPNDSRNRRIAIVLLRGEPAASGPQQ